MKSHWGTQRYFALYPCSVSSSKSSRDASTLVSKQTSTHYSCRSRRAFKTGRSTVDQVTLRTQGIEDSFSAKKNIRAALWEDHRWKAEWSDNTTRLHTFIPDTCTHPPGMTLPRTAWVRLNRPRTGVGRFRFAYTIGVWPFWGL